MNLLDQIKERKSKILAFAKENPNSEFLDTEIKITFHNATVSEIKKLAEKEGEDCLRYEKTLKRWYFCKTEVGKICVTVCVWSQHVTKNTLTSDVIDRIFQTDKTFENEKQYV